MLGRNVEFDILARDKTFQAFRQVRGNLDRTQRGVMAVDRSLAVMTGTMARFAAGIGIGFGAVGLAQLPRIVQAVVADVAALADVADKVGLTVEQLQEMRFAAEQSGVAANALDMGMQRFSRRVAEAAAGAGELLPILEANNIALRDQHGRMRPLMDILEDYAELIRNAGSQQDALLIAFKGFDSEGAALVNTLSGGAEGLNALRDAAREAGAVMEEDLVRTAADIDDQFAEIANTVGVKFKSAVVDAAAAGADRLEQMDRILRGMGTSIGELSEDFAAFAEMVYSFTPPGVLTRFAAWAMDSADEAVGSDPFADAFGQDFGGNVGLTNALRRRAAQMRGEGGPTTIIPPRSGNGGSGTSEADREANRLLQERERLFNSTRTAAEAYAIEQTRLGELLAQGVIDADLYNRGLDQARERFEAINPAARQAAEAGQFFGDMAYQALDDLIIRGADAEDVMLRLAQAIASAALEAALLGQGPLAGVFGGEGGLLGGIASGLFGGGARGPFGGFDGFLFHGGGIVGSTPVGSRLLPASVWSGAPRMHGGGLAGDEVPAILKKGEGVFTPEQMAALGGGGRPIVNVNVTSPPGFEADVQKRPGPGGSLDIDVLWRALEGHAARSATEGRIARATGQTFGLRRSV